jgi:hypothetical protein
LTAIVQNLKWLVAAPPADRAIPKTPATTSLQSSRTNRWFSAFAARPITRADFSRDFRSGILISEIKSPGSRRIGRFTGQQIPTAEPCSARPELGSAGLSLSAKEEEFYATGRPGRSGGPVCCREWPTLHGRRSGPLLNRAAETGPRSFRRHRLQCAAEAHPSIL